MKKVSEAHFQKVLKRQKSANSTKKVLKRQFEKCSNDNFYKTLYFNRKSFCNILGAEWHLLPLEKTKIHNKKRKTRTGLIASLLLIVLFS